MCKADIDADAASLAAIEAGASDIDDTGDQLIVYTRPSELEAIRQAIGEDLIESSDVELIAGTTVVVDDPAKARTLLRLIDALEDLDDVATVNANFDIPESILESIDQ